MYKENERKYDLSLFTLGLNEKDRREFYLEPKDKSKKQQRVRFIADSIEDCLIWYRNLKTVMRSDPSHHHDVSRSQSMFESPADDSRREDSMLF